MHCVFGASQFFKKFLSFIEVSAGVLDRWLLRSTNHQIWSRHDLDIEHVMRGELRSTPHLQFYLSPALMLLTRQHYDPD